MLLLEEGTGAGVTCRWQGPQPVVPASHTAGSEVPEAVRPHHQAPSWQSRETGYKASADEEGRAKGGGPVGEPSLCLGATSGEPGDQGRQRPLRCL